MHFLSFVRSSSYELFQFVYFFKFTARDFCCIKCCMIVEYHISWSRVMQFIKISTNQTYAIGIFYYRTWVWKFSKNFQGNWKNQDPILVRLQLANLQIHYTLNPRQAFYVDFFTYFFKIFYNDYILSDVYLNPILYELLYELFYILLS